MKNKTLLVIDSGIPVYREYALRSLSHHYDIVILMSEAVTWQHKYIKDSLHMPLLDIPSVIKEVSAYARKHPIDGIFTYSEPYVELATTLAAALQLPHNPLETAHSCRDKQAMRQRWSQAHVPSARSCPASSLETAREAASEIGYPVVIKPRAMSASIGVVRANSPEELSRGYEIANSAGHPILTGATRGVLIEEYLDGPEFSVECVTYNSQVHIVGITRKKVGMAPYFLEMAHIVAPDELILREQEVRQLVLDAHKALEINIGVTHAEVRLTSTGPRMVELAARCAGGLIPYLVQLVTNIDMAVAGADVAIGVKPSLHSIPTCYKVAAIHFFYPEHDAIVKALRLAPHASTLSWLHDVAWEVNIGDTVYLPPRRFISRLGYAVVTGQTVLECEQHIRELAGLTHFDLAYQL